LLFRSQSAYEPHPQGHLAKDLDLEDVINPEVVSILVWGDCGYVNDPTPCWRANQEEPDLEYAPIFKGSNDLFMWNKSAPTTSLVRR